MDLRSVQPPLRFLEGTEHIWEKLATIQRTGWVQWEIPNPENVAEHILAIRELAVRWRDKIELNDTDFENLLAIIEVHDWPEAIVGDMVVMGDERNVIALRNDKRAKERAAMEELCRDQDFGVEALTLYERYEQNADLPASYAKQLDKLQAVLLAERYEKQYGRLGLLKEFVTYSEHYVDIPTLVVELDAVRARM